MKNTATTYRNMTKSQLDAIEILRKAQNQAIADGGSFSNPAWRQLVRIQAYLESR